MGELTMVVTTRIDSKAKKTKRARAKLLSSRIQSQGSYSEEREKLWVELYRDFGMTATEIGADSGVQNQAVRRVLRRAGVMS